MGTRGQHRGAPCSLPSLPVEPGPAWPSATNTFHRGRLRRAAQGGDGREDQAPSGPGKGQLGRSPRAGRARSGPSIALSTAAPSSPFLVLSYSHPLPKPHPIQAPTYIPPHRPGAVLAQTATAHEQTHACTHQGAHVPCRCTQMQPVHTDHRHTHLGARTETPAEITSLYAPHTGTCHTHIPRTYTFRHPHTDSHTPPRFKP